jgi:hypothetical protein
MDLPHHNASNNTLDSILILIENYNKRRQRLFDYAKSLKTNPKYISLEMESLAAISSVLTDLLELIMLPNWRDVEATMRQLGKHDRYIIHLNLVDSNKTPAFIEINLGGL